MYPLKIKEKYDQKNLANLSHRFTTVYLGTYKVGDYIEGSGSHPGVDISPEVKNQDVFAVLDGVVFKAGEDGAYGKYVFLEHKNVPNPDNFNFKTTLYSCYQHLSEVFVKDGDLVKEGDIIGKTGNTGNSFGEHLHFQIDRKEAPFHAYWPFTSAEVKAAGVTFTQGVNIGLGIDKARMYTVNPLVYLDKIDELRSKNTNVINQNTNIINKKSQESIIKNIQNLEKIQNENLLKEEVINTIKDSTIKSEEKIKLISGNDVIKTQDINDILNLNNFKINNDIKTDINIKKDDNIIEKNVFTEKKENLLKKEELVSSGSKKDLLVSLEIPSSLNEYKQDKKTQKQVFFKDIKPTDKYFDYINDLASRGIVSGYSDNTFRPNNFITRVEILKLLFLIKNISLSEDNNNYFIDIPNNSWQKKYVNTAVNLNLVSTNNKKFNPNSFLTRVEALKMIITLFIGNIDLVYNKELNDVNGTEWYAKYVEYAINNGLFNVINNYFYPNKNITRYEVINILYKLSGK